MDDLSQDFSKLLALRQASKEELADLAYKQYKLMEEMKAVYMRMIDPVETTDYMQQMPHKGKMRWTLLPNDQRTLEILYPNTSEWIDASTTPAYVTTMKTIPENNFRTAQRLMKIGYTYV